ncbi:MAG: hypothetical protein VBE63_17715 [Lamprobacter sp.]|uniref:AcrVA2 family anti-CRISPR protein n=1 Tax=Lamprobacter sp. TaxID=3100796 RepID=UPI002B25DEFD|nr:hypothetical protein [Lamprobacter sp.]MEA3641754.1 hypothetical protein [Lamprobacter sp.]
MTETHRARLHLEAAGHHYPDAWKWFDQFREDRQALGGWPETVFCPLAGAYSVVSGGGSNRVPPQLIGDVARLGALAAWRPTQGIYRFDPDLFTALWDSPISDELPCELLRRMPAWCVYIELDEQRCSEGFYGFFAHLEYDPNNAREELRFLLDTKEALTPVPLHLGAWDLKTALERMADEALKHIAGLGFPVPEITPALAPRITPLISLLLYLCSEEADYQRPPAPKPKRTKRGTRLFPPDRPSTWDVGVRIGAALRKGRAGRDASSEETRTGTRPRPHIRRAHWHTYWKGPREGERTALVKWLAPIAVNLEDDDELPAVIHPVNGHL